MRVLLWVVLSFVPVLALAAGDLKTYATFPAEVPPGNLAITPDGRMFMSVHGLFGQKLKVVEVLADGSTQPYPPKGWAYAPKDGNSNGLNGVLGIRADRQGILWMLDRAALPKFAGRIIGWDTKTNRLHRILYLAPPAILEKAFLNDLAVDLSHGAIYITDTAKPDTAALIVVDLKTGKARRVLQNSVFTRPEDKDVVIDGRVIKLRDKPLRIGANPITLDAANTWVYFSAMSSTSLYRVRTTDLLDESLSEAQLRAKVERYGDKPLSDGITVDDAGNVYISEINENAVGVVGSDGKYRRLHQSAQMPWPDGFAVGPDNKIYVTVTELHRSPLLAGGKDISQGQFKIMVFDALAPATVGR